MSDKFYAQLIGSEELAGALLRGSKAVIKELSDAVSKAGYYAENKAKAYAPIKYGFLRGSINMTDPKATKDNVEVVVGTNVIYAPYQEYGTSRGIKPKFYFRKSRSETLPKLADYMKEAVQNILEILKK